MRCTCDQLLNDGPAACDESMRTAHNREPHRCCCATWGPQQCLKKKSHECACELLLCDGDALDCVQPCKAAEHECICETKVWVGDVMDCLAKAHVRPSYHSGDDDDGWWLV